jgi:hypothetical protein
MAATLTNDLIYVKVELLENGSLKKNNKNRRNGGQAKEEKQ